MVYDVDAGESRPLFWAPLRLPKGGWSSSCVVALNDHELVIDELMSFAELVAYDLSADGPATPTVLTRGLGIDRQPAFSPDGSQMIFSSNRSGNVDLWLRDQATGRLSQLTDDPAGDWDPAFTPDGRTVLWSSDRDGHMEIWSAPLDGSQPRRITDDGVDAENPTMTPDGRWIVYASSNDAQRGIWKIRPDGADATLLAPGPYLLPEVSPDGRYAVFTSIRNLDYLIHTMELETGRILPYEIELLVKERSQNFVLGRARWSPDGRAIVYVGQDDAGESGIYRQAFDPAADGPIAAPVRLGGFDPLFTSESLGVSPDGRWLVVSALQEHRTVKRASGVPRLGGF
jgi:TolB protein